MNITNEMALNIATNAGDLHMREAGRETWSSEDSAAATAVYKQLVSIVQNLDEEEGNE